MGDLRGAAMARSIFMEVVLKGLQTWMCRHCGASTTVLSEICDRCGKEDLEQGAMMAVLLVDAEILRYLWIIAVEHTASSANGSTVVYTIAATGTTL